MADDIDREEVVGTAYLESGRSVAVTAGEVLDKVAAFGENLVTWRTTPLGGGLVRVDFVLDDLDGLGVSSTNTEGRTIPLPFDSDDEIRADVPYFVLFDDDTDPRDAQLWTCTDDALRTTSDAWSDVGITLVAGGEDVNGRAAMVEFVDDDGETTSRSLEDFGLDTDNLIAFLNEETGRYLTLGEALAGLVVMRASLTVAAQAAASSAQAGRIVPKQDAAVIRVQHVPVTKLANKITEPALFDLGGINLDVASKSEKRRGKRVETHVSLSYDEPDNVSFSREIKAFDRDVLSALATLWANDVRTFTTEQVADALGFADPSKKVLEETRKALELLWRVTMTIDYTDEVRGREILLDGEPISSFKQRAHLFEATETDVTTKNGRHVTGYTWTSAPILYQYAHALGQVVNIPQRLLGIGRGSDTIPRMMVKRAILTRVFQLRRPRSNMSEAMKYRALFEAAGIDYDKRKSRKSMRDYVVSVLDDLKTEGYLLSYTETKSGNEYDGIVLKVKKETGKSLR